MPKIILDYFIKGESPDVSLIRTIRESLRMTTDEAADVIYVQKRTWENYENGTRTMAPAIWELFCIKTGLVILTKPKTISRQRKKTAEILAKTDDDLSDL